MLRRVNGRAVRRALRGGTGAAAFRVGVSGAAVCLLLAAALLPSPAMGQMETVTAPKVEEVTAELIESRVAGTKENKEFDETTRTKILELYRQAAENLKRVAELAASAAQHQQLVADMPRRQQDLRTELETFKSQATAAPLRATQSLVEIENELSQREALLAEKKRELAKLDAEPKRRAGRRKEIRVPLFNGPERLAEIKKQLDAPAPADEPAALTTARRTELLTRRKLVEQESAALEGELNFYDAAEAVDLVRLSRDLLTQQVAVEEQELKLLGETVNRRRRAEAEQNVRQARMEAYGTHPLLKPLAERNRELAEETEKVTQEAEVADRELKRMRTELDELKKEFAKTREKVTSIGLTGPIGLMLRAQRTALPDVRTTRARVSDREERINTAHLAIFEFDDERSRLANLEPLVEAILAEADSDVPEHDRADLELAAHDVLQKQREYLDILNRSYSTYFDSLVELDKVERQAIAETEEFANYIDSRVLWIRSGKMLTPSEIRRDRESFALLADFHGWRSAGRLLWRDLFSTPALFGSALLLFGSMFYLRKRFRGEFAELAAQAQRSNCYVFAPTLRAAFLTVMLSLLWPSVLLYIAWRLNAAADASEFIRSVGYGLNAVAAVYFPLEVFRQICRPSGLAAAHFGWSEGAVRLIRTNLRLLILLGAPLAFLTAMLHARELEHGRGALERLAFVAAMLVLAWFLRSVLHPVGGVFQELIAYNRGGWIDRLKTVWYVIGAASPLILAGLAVAGYYYTAQHLTWRLQSTAGLLLLLVVLRAFLLRWVLVHRRKLSIAQARERRAAALAEEAAAQGDSAAPTMPQPAPTQADLATISSQTERLLKTGLVAGSLMALWFVWIDVLPALSILDRWPLWYTTVQVTQEVAGADGAIDLRTIDQTEAITLANVSIAALIGIFTVIAARNFPGLLEMSLLQRLPLDASVRYAVTSLASYCIVVLGVVFGCGAVGLGWSKVQWLATALTFGLAFGLQEIFANFVAGLIILFERPIRVGDVVTIGEVTGVVSRVRIRATTITNWDRKEFIVPNKEFITGRLLNWTLSDSVNRITINVWVAFGTDTELTRSLLLQAAGEHPIVLDEPAPMATFEGFGESALNFTLRVYLPSMDHRLAVIHELHSRIHREFRAHGIQITFPQRELHIRSLPAGLGQPAAGAAGSVEETPDGEETQRAA